MQLPTLSMANTQMIRRGLSSTSLTKEQLVFLAKLPRYLNGTLETERIMYIALEHMQSMMSAQTAAVYLVDSAFQEVTFWALDGEESERVKGVRDYIKNDVIGSVIESRFPMFVRDASESREFSLKPVELGVGLAESFICTPIKTTQGTCIGAVMIMDKTDGTLFDSDSDVVFVEQFGHQVAMALEGARLFKELESRNETLEKLDRRKNEMITVLAHEFLTPLNIIRNSADLVADKCGNSTDHLQILALLQSGVERMTKLISQVKTVAVCEQRELCLKFEDIDVDELLNGLVGHYHSIVEKRGLNLSIERESDAAFVRADPVLLTLALQNLISNAVRYTPDGGEIKLMARKVGPEIEFRVCDTGIGIEESELPLIFEKFYEVADVMSHSSGEHTFRSAGLGLGLAAVRQILERHHSEIRVSSVIDEGTCFSFRLPSSKLSN